VFHLFRQCSVISRSHHSIPHPWRARSRERCAETLNAGKVGLFIVEGIGVGTSKSELTGFDVLQTERLPVEKLGKTLGSVSLVNTLSSGLGSERVDLVSLYVSAWTSIRGTCKMAHRAGSRKRLFELGTRLTSSLTDSSTP
jgi:hypothetical protein